MHADERVDAGTDSPRDAVRIAFKTEISDAISGIIDRDHFLQRLAQRAADVTEGSWVAIYTRAGTNGDLLLRSTTMLNTRPLPARISADRSQMTGDVVAYSGVNPHANLIHAEPIEADNEVMGALVLYSTSLEPLAEDQRQTLAVIAEEIAPAIAVAEHHHAVKQTSVVDLTTGAYANWYVTQRFDEEIARAQRTQAPVTIVIAAVQGFEDYQREAGFDAADELLRSLTNEFSGLTRVFDVVGVRARSEFRILLPDTDLDQAGTVIARVHQRSARVVERLQPAPVDARVHVVTGAASFPADGTEATSILLAAEHRFNQNEMLHRRMAERG